MSSIFDVILMDELYFTSLIFLHFLEHRIIIRFPVLHIYLILLHNVVENKMRKIEYCDSAEI